MMRHSLLQSDSTVEKKIFFSQACEGVSEMQRDFDPFTPKFKKYILLTFSSEIYERVSENW